MLLGFYFYMNFRSHSYMHDPCSVVGNWRIRLSFWSFKVKTLCWEETMYLLMLELLSYLTVVHGS